MTALSGSTTPNRLPFSAPQSSFEVVAGAPVDLSAEAYALIDRFTDAWSQGLRDLQNPRLQPFYAETPRSRVSVDDLTTRYAVISELANELGEVPIRPEDLVQFFLPNSAAQVFVEMLGRMGMEARLTQDLQTQEQTLLEYRGVTAGLVAGGLETAERRQDPTAVATLLDEIERPSLVTQTQHFVADEAPNDILDGDAKAHERLFSGFAAYVQQLVLLP